MRYLTKYALLFIMISMTVFSCTKENDNNIESSIYTGDTVGVNYYNLNPDIILNRKKSVNPMLTADDTLFGYYYTYYYDTTSIDINHDKISDLIIIYREGFTCNGFEIQTNGDTTCTDSNSLIGNYIETLNSKIKLSGPVSKNSKIDKSLPWGKDIFIGLCHSDDTYFGIQYLGNKTLYGWIRLGFSFRPEIVIKDYAIIK